MESRGVVWVVTVMLAVAIGAGTAFAQAPVVLATTVAVQPDDQSNVDSKEGEDSRRPRSPRSRRRRSRRPRSRRPRSRSHTSRSPSPRSRASLRMTRPSRRSRSRSRRRRSRPASPSRRSPRAPGPARRAPCRTSRGRSHRSTPRRALRRDSRPSHASQLQGSGTAPPGGAPHPRKAGRRPAVPPEPSAPNGQGRNRPEAVAIRPTPPPRPAIRSLPRQHSRLVWLPTVRRQARRSIVTGLACSSSTPTDPASTPRRYSPLCSTAVAFLFGREVRRRPAAGSRRSRRSRARSDDTTTGSRGFWHRRH
jgi:hypothetical protein